MFQFAHDGTKFREALPRTRLPKPGFLLHSRRPALFFFDIFRYTVLALGCMSVLKVARLTAFLARREKQKIAGVIVFFLPTSRVV